MKSNLGAFTNVVVIGAVAFALLRPTGPIGSAVVTQYQGLRQHRIVAREWPKISAVRRVDSTNSAISMVEFADYECPACRQQYATLHRVVNSPRSGGLAFRHRPLSIHPHAEGAARTAICAENQGKLREMHDRLFTTDAWLSDTNWTREAIAVGITDTAAFRECRSSQATTDRLRADEALADSLYIQATPTFVALHSVHVGLISDSTYLRQSRDSRR